MLTARDYPHILKNPGESARLERLPRVRVAQIVMDYLAHGWTAEQIGGHYPHLTLAEVHTALAYYFDHVPEIDAEIEAELKEVQRSAAHAPQTPLLVKLRAKLME
jgi:hypothetical protein